MARRKLSMSIIVLIVAATTLVSGTYAWFLVGGFAELFDLGFDVIEAQGGIQIQGSNGSAYKSNGGERTDWGSYLDRTNFNDGEILAEEGKYSPVSSADGAVFHKVGLEGNYFKSLTPVAGTDYNDFTIKVRSDNDQQINAIMKISMEGDQEALNAARISVTYDGSTTIYAANDTSADAVVTDSLPDATVYDNGNCIIDSSDTGFSGSYVSGQTCTKLTDSGSGKFEAEHALNAIPGNTGSKTVAIRIWIEGNDDDCTGEKLSQKHLGVKISFGSAE